MSNEIAIIENSEDMFIGLTGDGGGKFYCSMPMETEADKANLFNACVANDERLKAHVGKILEIQNVLCQDITVKNSETGEPGRAPRIVLLDKNGKTYGCVSIGILSALERIVGIFGPAPWNPPLRIEPILVQGTGNRTILSIKVHSRKD